MMSRGTPSCHSRAKPFEWFCVGGKKLGVIGPEHSSEEQITRQFLWLPTGEKYHEKLAFWGTSMGVGGAWGKKNIVGKGLVLNRGVNWPRSGAAEKKGGQSACLSLMMEVWGHWGGKMVKTVKGGFWGDMGGA